MDPAQFKTLVLSCTHVEEKGGPRKYDEESFAQRVIASASKGGGEIKQEVAATMVNELVSRAILSSLRLFLHHISYHYF
jgi:hypothetical protein